MKKILSLILALAMVMAISVTAFAEDTLTDQGENPNFPGSSVGEIKAVYDQRSDVTVHKYVVTIGWQNSGTLSYKNAMTTYTWDSDTLQYSSVTDNAGWSISDAKIAVTVTNKSSLPIVAECAAPVAKTESGVTAISGHYGDSEDATSATLNIDTVAPANPADTVADPTAPFETATYTITGVTGSVSANDVVIGTITVSINAAS